MIGLDRFVQGRSGKEHPISFPASAAVETLRFAEPSGPDARLASPTLMVTLISPRGGRELQAFAQEALPIEGLVTAPTAADALSLAQSNRIVGRAPAVFIFDFRGLPIGDLASEVKLVTRAHPDAELLVVADSRDSPVFAGCLQIVDAPDKLTFLLAPLHRQLTVEAIRTVTERYRIAANAKRLSDQSSSTVNALEMQIQELKARLDIAKHAARHDDLTGALNRTGFVEELTARLSRDHHDQNVLMIDLGSGPIDLMRSI
jgi:hypothetical protein